MKDFSEEIRESIEQDHIGTAVSDIETRRCSGDDYEDGMEYSIEGPWVTIKPILDVFSDADDYSIGNIGHTSDHGGSLKVFVVDVSDEFEHPAFA